MPIMHVFMLACIWSTLVSMHARESNYACMNVWVHAASDWSVGNRVWMMGDGDGDGSAVWGWAGGGWG